jgi:hypothetical protein
MADRTTGVLPRPDGFGFDREREREESEAMTDLTPVVQYLIWAMESRGVMRTQDIYRAFKAVCDQHKHKLPPHWQDEVRQTLQAHCPSQPQWKGSNDFFEFHDRGRWSCKVKSPTPDEL